MKFSRIQIIFAVVAALILFFIPLSRRASLDGQTVAERRKEVFENLQNDIAKDGSQMTSYDLYGKLVKSGQLAFQMHRYPEAAELFEKARKLLPKVKEEEKIEYLSTIDFITELHLNIASLQLLMAEKKTCREFNSSRNQLLSYDKTKSEYNQKELVNAINILKVFLKLNPNSQAARWLLFLSYQRLTNDLRSASSQVPMPANFVSSDTKFPVFRDVAPQSGLNTYGLGGGIVIEDFNNDGLLDIMTSSMEVGGKIHLFRNLGDGKFSDTTEEAGLGNLAGGVTLVQGDYDNDGYVDVFVVRGGWFGQWGRRPNALLKNLGDGTFSDVTEQAGLAQKQFPSTTAAWADYDNDGDLDLYIGNKSSLGMAFFVHLLEDSSQIVRRYPNALYRNNGDGTFTDVAQSAGVEIFENTGYVVWGDYNADGFEDLYVVNKGLNNRLYRNNRDGTFTDVASQLGLRNATDVMPAWFWDFNNDGHIDLFLSEHYYDSSVYSGENLTKDTPMRLFQGDHKGRFLNVASKVGLNQPLASIAGNFGDLDNDGFSDFYLGQGTHKYYVPLPSTMFKNISGEDFVDISLQGGFSYLPESHSIAFADLDNDGDQDVISQLGGSIFGDQFCDVVLENPGFSNRWITVKLIGVASNRSAIGARIKVEVTEKGKRRMVYAYVNSGGNRGSNSLQQEIGLGKASKIDKLTIEWPASGQVQVFRDVGVDQFIEITEGAEDYTVVSRKRFSFL